MRPILSKLMSAAKWLIRLEDFNRRRGRIITQWATLESSIDAANSYAWEYSDRSISKVVPMNLRWKIELFERIHRDLLPFQDLRRQADRLVEKVKALQEDRHWLAHGAIVPIYKEKDGWILRKGEFSRIDGSVAFLERHFTEKDLTQIERSARNLSFELVRYTYALLIKLGKDLPDNKSG